MTQESYVPSCRTRVGMSGNAFWRQNSLWQISRVWLMRSYLPSSRTCAVIWNTANKSENFRTWKSTWLISRVWGEEIVTAVHLESCSNIEYYNWYFTLHLSVQIPRPTLIYINFKYLKRAATCHPHSNLSNLRVRPTTEDDAARPKYLEPKKKRVWHGVEQHMENMVLAPAVKDYKNEY